MPRSSCVTPRTTLRRARPPGSSSLDPSDHSSTAFVVNDHGSVDDLLTHLDLERGPFDTEGQLRFGCPPAPTRSGVSNRWRFLRGDRTLTPHRVTRRYGTTTVRVRRGELWGAVHGNCGPPGSMLRRRHRGSLGTRQESSRLYEHGHRRSLGEHPLPPPGPRGPARAAVRFTGQQRFLV